MSTVEKNKKSKASIVKEPAVDYKISLYDYHPHHDTHMCSLVGVRNMKTVAELAQGAQFICFVCGRAAKKKEHLCEPIAV